MHNAQTTEMPLMLEIERAEGIYLYGSQGQRYIDLISGIGVSNIGHGNKAVLDAIQEQSQKYLHLMVYGEYVQSPQVQLAQKIVSFLPSQLDSVYFLNSGTEAIEGALKLAKRVTGRGEVIACHQSYHGSTHGALSLMGNEYYKEAYRPLLPGVHFIRYGNIEDIQKITKRHAAVFIETIQGESGVQIASKEYWQALRSRCDETGTMLVLDEIQCGMGRTGTLFAFQQYDIVPDILVLAKALGAGLPIGAFISRREQMQTLAENPILGHISTFGGHPLSCAAGLAGFNFLMEEDLISQVPAKAALFKKLLQHKRVKEIRGAGLMLSLQLASFEENKRIIDYCIAKGVIVDWFLHCSDAMRIAPPLIISETEIEEACAIILEALDS
jgi:acetylornithine/succinyldiaminopimelate/putrescine aminotransferase